MLKNHKECVVLCTTEHWKTEEQLRNLRINGFELTSIFCREDGYGGSAVYVKRGVKCKIRAKLNNLSISGQFECAVVECGFGKVQVLMASVYRPPSGDVYIFLDKLEQLLGMIFNENKAIFIVGDLNIEMLKQNTIRNELIAVINSFNLVQTIFENTRITKDGASCIDNIFTNSAFLQARTFEHFISDHNAQKILFKSEQDKKQNLSYRRFFTEENKDSFLATLRDQDWSRVYEVEREDVNKQWNVFMGSFRVIFEHHFPLKLSGKKQNRIAPDSHELIECKRRLDVFLSLSRYNQMYKALYDSEKRIYDQLLIKSRAKKYEDKVKKSDNKTKCMWSICKEIAGKDRNYSEIGLEGDPENIAKKYNEYLLSAIPGLLSNLGDVPFNCNISRNEKSMFLSPVNTDEICNIGRNINNKHSSGIDDIPTSIVKISIPAVQTVLCYLINNSFAFGIFPENLKIALIKPIHKKGDPENLDNYRPISLLPGFSKVFELAMSTRLVSFVSDCELFTTCQHGFIKGKSTQTAIFEFLKYVIKQLEKGEIALGMLLDLSKAYDCLDRELLLRKMEIYGIRGIVKKWFTSYISHRKQTVTITKDWKTCKSEILSNNIGIAQGSILGPILFILFVNDLPSIATLPHQQIVKYADDTNLIVGSKDIKDIVIKAEHFFNLATEWFQRNRLILNQDKTSILLFKTKQLTVEKPAVIDIGNRELPLSEGAKFLGVNINECFDWSCHIDTLKRKLNSIGYGIRVVGRYMNEKTLKIMYYANFESVLRYGIIFWGRHNGAQGIFVAQKRIIRIINKMDYNKSCRNVFRSQGIMTVWALYIYECLMFLFKNRDLFDLKPKEHGYFTRTSDLSYPKHRLTLTERCPHYMCLKLFNALPDKLKKCNSEKLYKVEIRKLLINMEPYNLSDFVNV